MKLFQSPVDNAPGSAKPEERLFPVWKLIGLGISVMVMMWILYINQPILKQIEKVEHPSDISLFFLENIHKENPQDESRRALLAKHQMEIGEFNEAQKILRPLLQSLDPELRKEARLLDLRIMEMWILAGGQDDQKNLEMEKVIATRVRELLKDSPSHENLPSLAESALLARDWELATQVYGQLAQRDPANQASWYRKGAKLALAKGAYTKAAEFFLHARSKSQSFEDKREDYLSALKALVAGDQLQEALVQAEKHLGDLDRDDVTLKFLVKLGRAAGNGAFAQKYVEKLLHVSRLGFGNRNVKFLPSNLSFPWGMSIHQKNLHSNKEWDTVRRHGILNWPLVKTISNSKMNPIVVNQKTLRPYDPEVYELAYTVLVENGQLEQAYTIAQRAGQAVPKDLQWRQRWAQVAEWTGRAGEALAQWQVVAQQAPSVEAWTALVRLAPGLTQPEEQARAQAALELVVAQGPAAEQRQARWALLERTLNPAQVQAHVQALLPTVQTVVEGEQLLHVALETQQWAETEQVLTQLMTLGTKAQGQAWYEQSAEHALGQGAYTQAAAWWFAVQGQAATRDEQRAAFQAGLQALVAGQQLQAAVAAVQQQLGELTTDGAAVMSAVEVLRAAGAGQEAGRYLMGLWAVGTPKYEAALYEVAYTVLVENGQLERAYIIAQRAGQAVPEDLQWRQRWAQVAEWTGRAGEALAQWQVVAQQAPSAEVWAALVRLGRGLRNLQAWTFGLEEMNKHSQLSPDQINELAGAYEQLGQPEKAIVQLQAELQKEPKKEVLEHLGLVYER
ncbi:MAG: hypothetical protein ACR2P1_17645, partial [Pseudomonadales bacterium]